MTSETPKIDAGKYKHLGVRALARLEKEELPPEFRHPALLISLDIQDEHTLWIARHLEGKTKVHKEVTHEVRQVPGTCRSGPRCCSIPPWMTDPSYKPCQREWATS